MVGQPRDAYRCSGLLRCKVSVNSFVHATFGKSCPVVSGNKGVISIYVCMYKKARKSASMGPHGPPTRHSPHGAPHGESWEHTCAHLSPTLQLPPAALAYARLRWRASWSAFCSFPAHLSKAISDPSSMLSTSSDNLIQRVSGMSSSYPHLHQSHVLVYVLYATQYSQ